MIEVKNVHKSFGGIKAVNNCSFEIEKGMITAVIGPNGSGKSTVFNIISQIVDEDSGKLYFDLINITNLKDYQVARLGISRTFQDVRLFRNLTIKEHLQIALSEDDEKLFKSVFASERINEERIKEVLNLVKLNKPLETLSSELSYGQRKLLDLAVAIAKKHKMILLDEPVAGVNPVLRQEIKDVLKELKKRGETILLIEHDMNFVMDLADYIIVLDEGKVLAEGKPKQIQNNKKVLEAYLGD